MTLEDLGNIGESVGAIGVIVSLVYLATQIRQNTKAVRSNTSQAITDSRVEFLSSISDNPEVARMFFSGLSDLDSLGPDERSRFAIMMARFIATMENCHYQHLRGAMDQEQWTRMLGILRWFMSTPGGQAWWSNRPIPTDLSFDRFLDRKIEKIRSSPAGDSQRAASWAETFRRWE
ncbi:MAG: hypothetical protein IH973_11865 [Myxococcales bacterium]|nr:hypothetical protein [Myxococcales bacterium]